MSNQYKVSTKHHTTFGKDYYTGHVESDLFTGEVPFSPSATQLTTWLIAKAYVAGMEQAENALNQKEVAEVRKQWVTSPV